MNQANPHTADEGAVSYTTRWNFGLHAPTPDSPWLTPSQAAELYAARKEFMVIDARNTSGESLRPRWALGFGARGVRAHFFTPGGGSIEQSTDFDARNGRLWRWTTTRYVYADDQRLHREFESVRMYYSEFGPDGTGIIEFTERGSQKGERAHMTDAPVSGFWLDWPAFGEWQDLTNMDYGLPEDPSVLFANP